MIHVLFVDDERLMLDLSKEFLEQQEEDFQVDTAISAEEALDRLSEREYDVVVSDYKMSVMDGLQFLSRLREQGNEIPFIIFTGKGREEVAVEAFRRGADGYVMKGGDPTSQYAELTQQIRLVVRERKAEEVLRKSEERYRTLVELAHDGIMRTEGRERIITFANHKMAKMLGYTVEELVGKRYTDLVHPDEKEEALQNIKSDLASWKPATYMRRLVKKDGSTVHTIVSVSLVNPNNQTELSPGILIVTDITERKKMEEALRESEEKYRTLVELAHEGIMMMNPSYEITFANPCMAEILGRKPGELVGSSYLSLVPPEERESVHENARKLREGRTPLHHERPLIRADGERISFLVSGTPLFDSKGTYIGEFGVFTDITKRKQIEEALRYTEQKLLSIVENLGAGLGIQDKNGIFTYVNPARARMIGYRPEEMIGKPASSFVHKDSLAKRDAEIAKRRRGESSTYEVDLVSKDGRTVPVQAIGTPLLDEQGEFAGYYGLIIDLTERKKMEKALQESEEKLRTLLEAANDGILISQDGRYVYANKKAYEMFKYSRDELVGLSVERLHPTIRRTEVLEHAREIREGERITPEIKEDIHLAKDGTKIPTEESQTTITWNGKSARLIIQRDITERKRIEDRERYLHSLLRHDLANKFQGAYGYLELLKRTTLQGKQEEYVENLHESLQDAIELIDKVRFLRTVDETRENVDLDLDLAIRDAIEDASSLAEEHGIAIDYEGIPNAMTTASPLLKNALANLIQNSIKHAECDKITITVRELKDRYHVTVRDDGKGIPDTVRGKLFERGVKGPGSSGSGLGLHLVKRIVEASNGSIQLKDAKKGTRFDIYLTKTKHTKEC